MYSDVTRVALYVRVSTDEQVREGYSIEAQKASFFWYNYEKKAKCFFFFFTYGIIHIKEKWENEFYKKIIR